MAISETVNGQNSIAVTGTAKGEGSLGVLGKGDAVGLKGESQNWHAVVGLNTGNQGAGVYGHSKGGAVIGESEAWIGVYGETHAPANAGAAGVWGDGKDGGDGVKGVATAPGKAAVCGFHVGTVGDGGPGVFGDSKTGRGVQGQGQVGVVGIGNAWIGVYGETHAPANAGAAGVWGDGKDTGDGVKGIANGPGKAAVCGFQLANKGPGIFGQGAPAGHFQGDVRVTNNLLVDGDITLSNADCAEDFDIAGVETVEPGTVMVLCGEGALKPSDHSYDRRVAGVVSGAGGYKPGIVLDKQPARVNRSSVALLGKVFCKVDAGYAPVEVGDLLTSSETPGHAMKAADPRQAFGAVIGKALRPLREGQGLIPILIALQ